MAVGIIIGAAFGKIIASFVEDILMPPIGRLFGKVDLANMFISLSGQHYDTLVAAKAAGAVTINYGVFLNTVINFLIVAIAVFLMIRQVNRMRRPAPAPATKECPCCLSAVALKATRCAHCTSELRAT